MKSTTVVFFAALLLLATAIPWRDQIALLNALEVGRNEDPNAWTCFGCDENTKPLSSIVI